MGNLWVGAWDDCGSIPGLVQVGGEAGGRQSDTLQLRVLTYEGKKRGERDTDG